MRDRTAIAEITSGNLPADIAYNYKGRAASFFFVSLRIIFGGTLQNYSAILYSMQGRPPVS